MYKFKDNIAVSDRGFIFNPETGESFTANPLGNMIIELFHDGKKYDEILNLITEKYDVDESTFEKDFQDFARELLQFQLIEGHEEKA